MMARALATMAAALTLSTLAPAALVNTALEPLREVAAVLAPTARAETVETADRDPRRVRVTYVEPIGGRRLYVELNNGAAYRLRPCRFEDGRHCYWSAGTSGNGVGRSFVAVGGRVIYTRRVEVSH